MRAAPLLVLLVAAAAAVVSSQELGTGGPEPSVLLQEWATNGTDAGNGTAAGANATAGNSTDVEPVAANATNNTATPVPPKQDDAKELKIKEKAKEGLTKAKMQAYLRKIKMFQRIKQQRWDPVVEQDLAEKLVKIDSLMEVTPEEKEIENKLRKGSGGMPGVEMSLERRAQEKSSDSASSRASGRAKRRAEIARIRARKRKLLEALAIKKVLLRYKKLAVPKELKRKHLKAKRAYDKAVDTEQSRKKTEHFQKFAQEYKLNGNKPGDSDGEDSDEDSDDASPTELGEDSTKPVSKDHVKVMTVQKVADALGHLQDKEANDDASMQHEQASQEDAEVDAMDKLDSELSDSALKQLQANP